MINQAYPNPLLFKAHRSWIEYPGLFEFCKRVFTNLCIESHLILKYYFDIYMYNIIGCNGVWDGAPAAEDFSEYALN